MSDPILIQIRFGSSSKWPSDLKAIGAAKTALLIQLANGIETAGDKGFDGPIVVTPSMQIWAIKATASEFLYARILKSVCFRDLSNGVG